MYLYYALEQIKLPKTNTLKMTVLKPQPKIHSAGTAPTPNHISNNALL
jgi:hypothetical protein